MKPLPESVSVCEGDPATTLAGDTEETAGVGFGVLPEEGLLGVEGDFDPPPPQPDTSRQTESDTTSKRSEPRRNTDPPKEPIVQEKQRAAHSYASGDIRIRLSGVS